MSIITTKKEGHMKLNTKGFSHVELVIVVVVLGLIGGASYYVYNKNNTLNSETTQSETAATKVLPASLDEVLSLEKVEEIAKKDDTTLSIKGIELKTEDGLLVYVIHLSNGKELTINATTGDQIALSDDDGEDDDTLPANLAAKISLTSALAVAKKEHPGVAIEKIEIETEDGILVYRVKFIDEALVEVDANNGSIMEVKAKDGKEVKKRSERRNDDDHDDDGKENQEDNDDDDDGREDDQDEDDDQDEVEDDEDEDDDNDDVDDSEDDDSGEDEIEDGDDNSGSRGN